MEASPQLRPAPQPGSPDYSFARRWNGRTRTFGRSGPIARRHVSRSIARLLTLVASDLAFSGVATLTMGLLAAWSIPGGAAVNEVAVLVRGGASEGPLYFLATLLIGLLLTGNYRLRRGPYSAGDLLSGCILAVVMVYWAPVRTRGVAAMIIPSVLTTLVLWAWIAVGRRLTLRVIRGLLPSASGMVPSAFLGTEEQYREAKAGGNTTESSWHLIGFIAPDGTPSPNALGELSDLPRIAATHRIETVIVAPGPSDVELDDLFDLSLEAGCTLLYPARALRAPGLQPNLVWRMDQPFFELGALALRGEELFLKRLLDGTGAFIGLVLLSPILVLTALVIKLDSSGPVFFVQHRAGLYGRRFRMLKFRTMRAGADAEKTEVAHLNRTGDPRLFKIPDDPRVTRIGRWLRRWSIDELPQLWNVLVGDMSLAGPRPFFDTDLADYEAHHFRRLDVKPGITGLWQVTGRSDVVDFDEVVRLDREYIERWSLWLDLTILARTIPAVLRRHGAY